MAERQTLVDTGKGIFDANFVISLILALAVWGVLRTPEGWQTFLGEADREALQIAFEMRVNSTVNNSRPILFLNLDESVWRGDTPEGPALAYAPRRVIADLLEAAYGMPGFPRPKVVVADIDLFWRTPEEEQEQRIDEILDRWSKDPEAPLLIMQREVVEGYGGPNDLAYARPSRRDAIIENAPARNITWAVAQITGDEVVGARYFTHFLCLRNEDGSVGVAPTTALYAIAGRTAPRARDAIEAVDRAMEEPRQYCAGEVPDVDFTLERTGKPPLHFIAQDSFINYSAHTDGPPPDEPSMVAADMFVIPAGYVNPPMLSGLAANEGVVIIGSAARMARDRHMTPYGLMGGSLIIANTIRGLEASGQIHRLHWALDAAILTFFVVVIVLAFWYARRARDWLGPVSKLTGFSRLIRTPINLLTNPVIVKLLIGLGIFWFSTIACYYLLDFGIWVGFAAPAYVAALNEAREDFEELMESLRNARQSGS